MANNVAKGTAIEREAIRILEDQGYTVHRCTRTPIRTGRGWIMVASDVFGCIDLLAKNSGPTRWVQVTGGRNIGRKIRELEAVPWNDTHDSVEIWRWIGGGKRLDGRNGKPRQTLYFQIYRRCNNYQAIDGDHAHVVRRAAVGRAAPAASEDRDDQAGAPEGANPR